MIQDPTLPRLRVRLECPACGADVVMAVMPHLTPMGEMSRDELHLRLTAVYHENQRLRARLKEMLDALKKTS